MGDNGNSERLKKGKVQTFSPTIAGLPDPAKAQSTTEALLTVSANDSVEEMGNGRTRKRVEYVDVNHTV
ncbi:hypothetical protein DPMN_129644, partial [Dreissena polymorpha]